MSYPNILLFVTDDERYLNFGGSVQANRITNPQGLIDTAGWTNGGMVTFTAANNLLTTTGLPTGADALTKGFNFVGDANGDHIRIDAPVTNGTRYRFSAYVRLSANTATGVRLSVFDAGAVSFATSTTLSATGGGMTRLDVDFTANATATWTMRLSQVAAGGVTGQATAFMLQTSSTLNPYFDGSYISCSWAGTAHQSISNKSAAVSPSDARPNINTVFGAGGTKFTRFFIEAPVCGPSRCTTLSGLRASQHGALDINKTSEWDQWYSVQRQLQQLGYRTGGCGKFNNFIDFDAAEFFDWNLPIPASAAEPATLLAAFRGFLATQPEGQPWFFLLSTNIPHEPYTVTPTVPINIPTWVPPDSEAEPSFTDKHQFMQNYANITYDPAEAALRYYGMIREMAALDEVVDNIWAELPAAEQNDTLAIYMSDNGYLYGDHKLLAKQWPYMGSIHCPLYIRWTNGNISAGVEEDKLSCNLDITPTILGAVGKTCDYPTDGLDLLDSTLTAWSGAGEEREWLYLEYPSDDLNIPPWEAYLSGPHTDIRHYIRYLNPSLDPAHPVENYDLAADPAELSASNTNNATFDAALDSVDLNFPAGGAYLTISDGNGNSLEVPGVAPSEVLGTDNVSPSAQGREVRGGIYLSTELVMPKPVYENTYTSGPDAEGMRRTRSQVQNATGSGTFFITGQRVPEFFDQLQRVAAAAHEERGTVTWQGPNAAAVTYDLEAFELDIPDRHEVAVSGVASVPFTFEARAYGRLDESVVFTGVQLDGPQDVIEIPESSGGHVDALGKLTLTEISSESRQYGEIGWDHDPPWYYDLIRQLDPSLFWTMGAEPDVTIGGVTFQGGFSNQTGSFKNGTAHGGVVPGRGEQQLAADSSASTIFDGADDYVTTTFPLWAGSSTSFSFSCLAIQDTNAATMAFFGGDGAATSPVLRNPSGGSTVTFRIDGSDAGATSSTTWAAALPALGTPFHLAFTFNATANTAELWIDGISLGVKTGLSAGYNTAGNLQIGAFAAVASQFWDGRLQAVTAWQKTITDLTARQLYGAAKSPYITYGNHLVTSGYAGVADTHALSVSSATASVTATALPVSLCSTGALPHHGPYRIWARIWPTTDDVQIRLAWRTGGGPLRQNDWNTVPGKAAWFDMDLGIAEIEQLPGLQTWEAVIQVQSATLGEVDVDTIEYIPADSWGRARAPVVTGAAVSLSGYDTFLQPASPALTGQTAPLGGVWVGAGSAGAHNIDSANDWVTRATNVSETEPHFSVFPTVLADQTTQTDTWISPANVGTYRGVTARLVDTSNWLAAWVYHRDSRGAVYLVQKRVAGATTDLGMFTRTSPYLPAANVVSTLRLSVDAAGRWSLFAGLGGTASGPNPAVGTVNPVPVLSGYDADLATGGAIASGKAGIADWNTTATAITRYYDNVYVWGAPDSATSFILYSGKTAEFTHEAMRRQDSTGAYMGVVPLPEGEYLRLPPKRIRMVARFRRNDIASGLASTGTASDVTADLLVTRRVLLGGV